jgi:hypothetical protein
VTGAALDTVDRRIAELRSTVERIGQNLVELDADVTRQMLDASASLTGQTANRWHDAQQRLSSLWQGQLALADVLERVVDERGSRSSVPRAALGRLATLLGGPSVSVARPDAPRALTEGTAPTDALTIDEVIARMSGDYDSVTALVGEVAAVWTVVVPRLGALEATVAELEAAADAAATRRPNDLASARRAIGDAGDLARSDPLAVPDDVLTRIAAMVDRASSSLRASLAVRHELQGDLTAARACLAECVGALERARVTGAEVAARILLPDGEGSALARLGTVIDDLQHELAEASRLGETNPAVAARVLRTVAARMAGLRGQIDELEASELAALATRDELRGRLDAYRAKAQAVGRGEDLELDLLYVGARDLLHSAPCDLVEAEARVTSYQRSISSPRTSIDLSQKGTPAWPNA